MRKYLKGFTLVEVLVVTGIVAVLFGSILTFLTTSDRSWSIGQDKLTEQQHARIAIDEIIRLLRCSSPSWNSTYGVTISGTTQISFYVPGFGGADNRTITELRKIYFRLNPDNATQLLKKDGIAAERVVAQYLSGINFSCACAGCTAVNNSCPFVNVNLTTQKQSAYNLQSKITLRNINSTLPAGVSIIEGAL